MGRVLHVSSYNEAGRPCGNNLKSSFFDVRNYRGAIKGISFFFTSSVLGGLEITSRDLNVWENDTLQSNELPGLSSLL